MNFYDTNKQKANTFILCVLSIILAGSTLKDIVPKFFENVSDLEVVKGKIIAIEDKLIEDDEHGSGLERTLLMTLDDGSVWHFSEKFSKYFKIFLDIKNINKPVTIYRNPDLYLKNPYRVDIQNKIIYSNVNEINAESLQLACLATFVILYTVYRLIQHFKAVKE